MILRVCLNIYRISIGTHLKTVHRGNENQTRKTEENRISALFCVTKIKSKIKVYTAFGPANKIDWLFVMMRLLLRLLSAAATAQLLPAPALRILTHNDEVHVLAGNAMRRHRHLADVATGVLRPHVVQLQLIVIGQRCGGGQFGVFATPVVLWEFGAEGGGCVVGGGG